MTKDNIYKLHYVITDNRNKKRTTKWIDEFTLDYMIDFCKYNNYPYSIQIKSKKELSPIEMIYARLDCKGL